MSYDPPSLKCLIGEDKKGIAHSLDDFFATPRRVDMYTWSTTDALGAEIVSLDFPNTLFTTGMLTRKVADFRFFRPNNLHIKFVINANKFCVGKLMCVWEPFPEQKGIYNPSNELTTWSSYPCAYIDVGTMPEIEWQVPFVSDNTQYDLLNDTYQYGRLRVIVLNQLKSTATSDSAHITVYTWLSNVQLSVRTINPDGYTIPGPLAKYTMQSAEVKQVAKNKTITGAKGPISSAAERVAKFGSLTFKAGVISKSAPVAAFGAATEWISKLVGMAASSFGYSKVQSQDAVSRMVELPCAGYTNCNGIQSGVVLAADAENSLSIDQSVLGDNYDAMDIQNICSKEAFLMTRPWSNTLTEGDVIMSWPVMPGYSGVPTASGITPANTVVPTPMAYVASMFDYWRGDIDFRLSFVANDFYAGRVAVAFLSGIYSVSNPVDLTTIEAAPKIICDIQSAKECVFTIDYAAQMPWLRNRVCSWNSTSGNLNFNNILNSEYTTGIMVMYVVNPLKHPDSVPAAIDVNLFTKGRNVQFACPQFNFYKPYYPLNDPMLDKKTKKKYTMQGINVVEPTNAQGIETSTHKLMSTSICNIDPCALCVGECITNLRCLTRRFGWAANEFSIASGNMAFIDPAFMGVGVTSVPLHYISGLYAFYRGSIRYMSVVRGQQVVTAGAVPLVRIWNFPSSQAPATQISSIAIADPKGAPLEHLVNTDKTPIIDFTVPYYRKTAISLRTTLDVNDDRMLAVYKPNPTGAAHVIDLYCAGGDDFSFGYLIGPPYLQNR